MVSERKNPFRDFLRLTRKNFKWTQSDVAEKLGLAKITIAKLEAKTLPKSFEILMSVLDLYGYEISFRKKSVAAQDKTAHPSRDDNNIVVHITLDQNLDDQYDKMKELLRLLETKKDSAGENGATTRTSDRSIEASQLKKEDKELPEW
ncbi:MAG: helix-turn-helix domain-containing protein [Oligoflexus sp.]